jgi:hypothetical protein
MSTTTTLNNESPHATSRVGEGERKLLLALVLDAVLEVQGQGRRVAFSSPVERRVSRKRSLRWLMSDAVYACPARGISFAWVCEHVGLDKSAVRSAALRPSSGGPRYVSTR